MKYIQTLDATVRTQTILIKIWFHFQREIQRISYTQRYFDVHTNSPTRKQFWVPVYLSGNNKSWFVDTVNTQIVTANKSYRNPWLPYTCVCTQFNCFFFAVTTGTLANKHVSLNVKTFKIICCCYNIPVNCNFKSYEGKHVLT